MSAFLWSMWWLHRRVEQLVDWMVVQVCWCACCGCFAVVVAAAP